MNTQGKKLFTYHANKPKKIKVTSYCKNGKVQIDHVPICHVQKSTNSTIASSAFAMPSDTAVVDIVQEDLDVNCMGEPISSQKRWEALREPAMKGSYSYIIN